MALASSTGRSLSTRVSRLLLLRGLNPSPTPGLCHAAPATAGLCDVPTHAAPTPPLEPLARLPPPTVPYRCALPRGNLADTWTIWNAPRGWTTRVAGFHSATPSQAAASSDTSASGGGEGRGVVEVMSPFDLQQRIEGAPVNDVIVVDFTAHWCRPCQMIAPFLSELLTKYKNLTVLKVDIDRTSLQEAVEAAKVSGVPTFHFYKSGKLVANFTGADRTKLEETIKVLGASTS